MPRPTMKAGEVGSISTIAYVRDPETGRQRPQRAGEELPVERYKSKARLRTRSDSYDPATGAYAPGPRVDVYAWTPTDKPRQVTTAIQKAAAAKLAEQRQEVRTVLSQTVGDKAEEVLGALVPGEDMAQSSLYVYKAVAKRHLSPSKLGQQPVTEATTKDVDDFLGAVAKAAGVGVARHCRTILNRTFRAAVVERLVATNPMLDTDSLRGRKKAGTRRTPSTSRKLSAAERVELSWFMARSRVAKDLDLRDPVLCNLALGARIGEVFAIRWVDIHMDFASKRATVSLNSSLGRDIGAGTGVTRGRQKTDRSLRVLPVPRRVYALLARRARAAGVSFDSNGQTDSLKPLFPSPGRGGAMRHRDRLRDKENAGHRLRELFDEAGFTWLSMHGLRRTVITMLADQHPIRVAADFAGHASVRTTQESYIARGIVDPSVADLL